MLNHLAGRPEVASPITEMSIHSAYPPDDLNELSGGTYARKAMTFTDAGVEASGRIDFEAMVFDIPAGSTVRAVAYRAADGTILLDDIVPEETYNQAGQYKVEADSYINLDS